MTGVDVANSWHATAVGSWASGAWTGEIGTVGLSGIGNPAFGYGPDINAALPDFGATADGSTGTTTHCTVSYGSNAFGDNAWSHANQDAIAEALWTLLSAWKVHTPPAFSWKEIRLSAIERIGGEDKVVNGASVYTITSPLAGSYAQAHPPQTAIVCSLKTGGRGARNHGRIFIPASALTVASDGLLNASDGTTIRNAMKTCLTTMNALTGVRAAVVSRVHQTYSDITGVRTGDEFDTQRRRRNKRPETYATTTFP